MQEIPHENKSKKDTSHDDKPQCNTVPDNKTVKHDSFKEHRSTNPYERNIITKTAAKKKGYTATVSRSTIEAQQPGATLIKETKF